MTLQMAQKKIKIKKKVEALHIPPHLVDEYWMLVEFMLREGLKFDGNPMSIEHLKSEIMAQNFQLFMMFGSDEWEMPQSSFHSLTKYETISFYFVVCRYVGYS